MPGLVGIVTTNGDKVDPNLLETMGSAIKHHSWYKSDCYVNPKGTIGVSRVHLGIINKGKQPYSPPEGQVKVFLHGELYNDEVAHVEPMEFVYRLYEKEGLGFVSFLNGSFLVIVVDEREGMVIVANDRLASKPLRPYILAQR
jgi:asparagine synthetase B (glutamine-hydrolysing)